MREQFKRASYNYSIKQKLNIRSISLSVGLENGIL